MLGQTDLDAEYLHAIESPRSTGLYVSDYRHSQGHKLPQVISCHNDTFSWPIDYQDRPLSSMSEWSDGSSSGLAPYHRSSSSPSTVSCYSDIDDYHYDAKANLATWPMCNSVGDGGLIPIADIGASPQPFSPVLPSGSPCDLLYSPASSVDEIPQNVFDLTFADAFTFPDSYASPSSLSSSCSPSPSPNAFVPVPLPPKEPPSPGPRSAGSQNNPRRRFPCPLPDCDRRFTSQYTLKVHVEAHKPKPKISFPCTMGCSERFSRQHDRLRHEVAKHGKICEFSCEECGRFFSSKKTLGNHKCPMAQGETRWIHV